MSLDLQLTQGAVAIIDDVDGPAVAGLTWSAHRTTSLLWYARAWTPPSGRIMMHTLLTGWPITDHMNGNGLDNRRTNLRRASRSQNMANRRKLSGSSSAYKGVSLQSDGKWKAQIGHARRRIYLGLFCTADGAARAYDEAARQLFGEFAALNFPREGERSCFAAEGAL